jgi:hypothetical protein
LQDPCKVNGDILSGGGDIYIYIYIRPEARRHVRNKKREYLKDKINELATNSKNENIRDLYRGRDDFKRGCQPKSKLVKDENGDLHEDSHKNFKRWKNYFPVIGYT